jgi:hypothetical protein
VVGKRGIGTLTASRVTLWRYEVEGRVKLGDCAELANMTSEIAIHLYDVSLGYGLFETWHSIIALRKEERRH